jgi:hypothetical protein
VAEISFASLSPSLLARKGGAKPAMRPQHAALASMPNAAPEAHVEPEALEDLGWNDMGEGEQASPEVFHLTPMARAPEIDAVAPNELPASRPAVLAQQHEIVERLASPPQPARRRASAERGSRAAFTLRLDPDRHLKLRLATTIRGVSAQALVTDALDALLGDMPELDTLAAQVKRR